MSQPSDKSSKEQGRRVLVVEDEVFVAMYLEDMLISLGFTVVGPAGRLAEGLQLAKASEFDVAILDVNLAGEFSYPIADALTARGIPYIFATGYGSRGLDQAHRSKGALRKPFGAKELTQALAGL
jgi:CheY-like chemotaxis protein